MPINVSTTDIIYLALSLHNKSGNMQDIVRMMQSRVSGFSSWNDREGEQFKELTSQISRQLIMHMENFEKMSKFLNAYAKKMEEAAQAQARRMNNIG